MDRCVRCDLGFDGIEKTIAKCGHELHLKCAMLNFSEGRFVCNTCETPQFHLGNSFEELSKYKTSYSVATRYHSGEVRKALFSDICVPASPRELDELIRNVKPKELRSDFHLNAKVLADRGIKFSEICQIFEKNERIKALNYLSELGVTAKDLMKMGYNSINDDEEEDLVNKILRL